ncbi:hypothetical protein NC652_034253 [Populus alba x Populus x berolinensis]|nr:hypothetical protein NC652_034253 [Populus alba x Populus x berolinensis]
MSLSEIACTYATLILHDEDISITSDKIATLVKAANVTVESYWPSLFAKLAEKRNVGDLIMNIGGGGGGAAPVAVASSGPAAGGAAAPAVEEKKEEAPESDDDMGFSLFSSSCVSVSTLLAQWRFQLLASAGPVSTTLFFDRQVEATSSTQPNLPRGELPAPPREVPSALHMLELGNSCPNVHF